MGEVKENLVAADRKATLKRFDVPHFKKIAKVVMGEPDKEYKDKTYAQLLVAKQAKADREFKAAKLEKERKKAIAKRQKEIKAKGLKKRQSAFWFKQEFPLLCKEMLTQS